MLSAKPVLVLNDSAPQAHLPEHRVGAVPWKPVEGLSRGDRQLRGPERVDSARVLTPRRGGGRQVRAVPPFISEDRPEPPPRSGPKPPRTRQEPCRGKRWNS